MVLTPYSFKEDLTEPVAIDADAAIDVCEAALREHPAGLLVDVDGTISPIVSEPTMAYVLPGCRDALDFLAGHLNLVGVLSGRLPQDAHRMVGLDTIQYWGGHGVAHLSRGTVKVAAEAEKFRAAVAEVEAAIARWPEEPGLIFEKKGTSVAVHYRLAPDTNQARDHLYGRLAPLARANGLDLLEGRMVFEVRPPGLGKGWCIQKIIHEHGLAGVVYIGDDQTDSEAFAAVDGWRETGPRRNGVNVAVDNPEAPHRKPLRADFVVPGVSAVERLLQELAARFV